jgi:hypothetical protein
MRLTSRSFFEPKTALKALPNIIFSVKKALGQPGYQWQPSKQEGACRSKR